MTVTKSKNLIANRNTGGNKKKKTRKITNKTKK